MADILFLQGGGHWDTFKSHPELPLGILSACAYAHEKYDIKIIDMRVEKDWEIILKQELAKGPLMAAFSCILGVPIKQALEASKVVKEVSNVPVVWGGAGPTSIYKETIKHPLVDIVVRGEGEYALQELADALKTGSSLREIKGLVYKENGEIIINEEREFCDLNELPLLPYHLVDIENYKVIRRGVPAISIETSRGCPHNCTFCSNSHLNKHKWRCFSAEESVRRIEYACKTLNVNAFFIIDDNFFVNIKRTRAILQGLLEKNLKIRYELQGARIDSLDMMTDEDIELLEKTGCQQLDMGLESGSQKILDSLHKGYKVEQLIRVNRRLSTTKINLAYNVIVGYPNETYEDLTTTIKIILQVLDENKQAHITSVNSLLVHPATQMFEDCKDLIKTDLTLEDVVALDYANIIYPWLTPERAKLLEAITIAANFIDDKVFHYVHSPMIRLFTYFYQPIAKWRFRNMNFNFMFEVWLKKLLFKMYNLS